MNNDSSWACCLRLLAFATLLIGTHAAFAQSQMCLVPEAGAPSCGVTSSPGSSPVQSPVPHHVGNPIDVVSGNKYQYELDYRSFTSGLTLARHYNSSLSHYNVDVGPGWRHTYQVVMTKVNDDQLNIVQSDGRLINFRRTGDVFRAASAADGYLEFGDRSVWHLADGRRMVFMGSYLVLIAYGDHRGTLTLFYKNRKLHTVTDSRGDVLTFNYVPGTPSLPDYGSNNVSQPSGSIASVTLPSGNDIVYTYDRLSNLASAAYPDGDSVGYGYSDETWPNHLTLRQSTAENRISEWQYDDSGQAVRWIENGGDNGLDINRELSTATATATVTYTDGRQTQYLWQHSAGVVGDSNWYDITCDNCLATPEPSSALIPDTAPETTPAPTPAPTPTRDSLLVTDGPTSNISLGTTLPSLWNTLRRSNTLTGGLDHDEYVGDYSHSQGTLPVKIKASRTGKVIDVEIAGVSLLNAGRRTLLESLPPCAAGSSHERILALASRASPCNTDGLLYAELVHELETYSKADLESSSLSLLRGRAKSVPWYDPMRRYCSMPAGKSCADLARDLEMAELSKCAYGYVSCEPKFTLVPPNDNKFGLSADRYSLDGFDAQLYKDPSEDRYILVFRGTDGLSDWGDNIDQAFGVTTRQYRIATKLASDLAVNLGTSSLEFSGHSLGGGLATAAAVSTSKNATIFNAAALQRETVEIFGLGPSHDNANNHINHIHTESDPVTLLQAASNDANFLSVQSVPGISTQIPNPDIPWMNAAHANAQGFADGLWPTLWHSMDAVIHVIESLIKYNCIP